MRDHVTIKVSPIASSKNRRRIIVKGRQFPLSLPSRDADASKKEIRQAFLEAVRRGGVLWQDEDISVDVTFSVPDNQFTIILRPLGPRPHGRTGRKRDLHGVIETVCDALEGLAFRNDNQVAHVQLRRTYES